MTHDEFKRARRRLGLSVREAARVLGCSELQVRRMEMAPETKTHRAVSPTTARLMQAFLAGYRPPDWPARDPL